MRQLLLQPPVACLSFAGCGLRGERFVQANGTGPCRKLFLAPDFGGSFTPFSRAELIIRVPVLRFSSPLSVPINWASAAFYCAKFLRSTPLNERPSLSNWGPTLLQLYRPLTIDPTALVAYTRDRALFCSDFAPSICALRFTSPQRSWLSVYLAWR